MTGWRQGSPNFWFYRGQVRQLRIQFIKWIIFIFVRKHLFELWADSVRQLGPQGLCEALASYFYLSFQIHSAKKVRDNDYYKQSSFYISLWINFRPKHCTVKCDEGESCGWGTAPSPPMLSSLSTASQGRALRTRWPSISRLLVTWWLMLTELRDILYWNV